jgi:hypothetical protein
MVTDHVLCSLVFPASATSAENASWMDKVGTYACLSPAELTLAPRNPALARTIDFQVSS